MVTQTLETFTSACTIELVTRNGSFTVKTTSGSIVTREDYEIEQGARERFAELVEFVQRSTK
jgi:hypothetical protein